MQRTKSRTREVAQLLALVQARRRYYRDMLSLLPSAVAILAGDGSLRFANSAFCREFALREEDVAHTAIAHILSSDALHRRILAARLSGVCQRPFSFQIREKTLRISVVPMDNWRNSREIDTLLLIENPREIEQARLGRQKSNATLMLPEALSDDQFPAVLWQAGSPELVFHSVRGAARELLGFPEDHWKTTPDFFAGRIHPEDRAATLACYRAAIEQGGEASAEFRGLSSTGFVWLRETIFAAAGIITGVITPIGARRTLEAQRIREERLRAVGGLARTAAVSLAGSTATLAAGSLENDSESASGLERISQITKELDGFTTRQPDPPGIVNLPRLLKQLHDRRAATGGRGVSVAVNAEQSVLAFAEESQLDEVITALTASICRDALEGSRLTITCDLNTVTERIPGATLAPGNYARLVIHHHGRGLEFELQEPVFESLLSSPHSKRDTLPALSRAYNLVRDWGGDIALLREPDSAAFIVYLPHCPSVELEVEAEIENDPILFAGHESGTGETSYRDLVDLLLAEAALRDPDPLQMDVNFFERPLS